MASFGMSAVIIAYFAPNMVKMVLILPIKSVWLWNNWHQDAMLGLICLIVNQFIIFNCK